MFEILKRASLIQVIIALIFYLFLFWLVSLSIKDNSNSKEYKYMISVGNATLNYGYETNEYKDSLGYIVFIKKDGTNSIYPKEKIFSINQKKQ